MSTLTKYDHLKAYWFNPKEKKVTLRVRDFRDYGTYKDREAILTKLVRAREAQANGNT